MLQALRQCLAVFGCFLSGCVADTLPVASKQSDVPGKDSVVAVSYTHLTLPTKMIV